MNQSRFEKRPAKPTLHPRKVIGGIKLRAKFETTTPAAGAVGSAVAAPTVGEAAAIPVLHAPRTPGAPVGGWGWASALWLRLAEDNAPTNQLSEGLAYARAGQARSLDIQAGLISGRVQGRMPGAYTVEIRMPTFTQAQWETTVASISGQARYAAALLGGELPGAIEEVFAPEGLRLFPSEPSDLGSSCTCDVFGGRGAPGSDGDTDAHRAPWCKHVCCLMYLVAERLSEHPLTLFALRGLPETELLDRLRQARTLAGVARTGMGAVPIYSQHIPSVGMAGAQGLTAEEPGAEPASPRHRALRPLDQCVAEFWEPDDQWRGALEALDLPIERPEVTHPLLRRLGASPFTPGVGTTPRAADVALERGRRPPGSRWASNAQMAAQRAQAAERAGAAAADAPPTAKFPLVGLLATCYDVISDAALSSDGLSGRQSESPQTPPPV